MSAYDAACEALKPVLAAADPREALVAAKCMGLMAGYSVKWTPAGEAGPYRIDAVESVMTSDLYNPETQRKSRSFILGGKLDVRATEIATGAKVLFDHKTTSSDISDANGPYWRILAIEGQVSHYMLLEWMHANKVDFGIWDVVRKPGISPKALAKADVKITEDTGIYCNVAMTDGDRECLKNEGRETPRMYAARLAWDCMLGRPEWYFQRRRVPRLDAEIREYAIEVWGHSQDILATRQTGRWPRNSGACYTYNTPCRFLGLCSGHDTLDSGQWTTRPWVHPELPVLGEEGRGLDILTNSRIRCFQSCRRKHYLQYELGVEKIDEEEKESLFFGNLFHTALEAYFIALQQEQKKPVTTIG